MSHNSKAELTQQFIFNRLYLHLFFYMYFKKNEHEILISDHNERQNRNISDSLSIIEMNRKVELMDTVRYLRILML